MSQIDIDPENILWEKAIFAVGITDMRGIQDDINVKVNEKDYKASPGLKTTDIASSGIHCTVALSPNQDNCTFPLQLNLNGSQ